MRKEGGGSVELDGMSYCMINDITVGVLLRSKELFNRFLIALLRIIRDKLEWGNKEISPEKHGRLSISMRTEMSDCNT